jgi:hypothetical protein
VVAAVLALQDHKMDASAIESQEPLLDGQVVPDSIDLSDDHRAARPMHRFVTANLILR